MKLDTSKSATPIAADAQSSDDSASTEEFGKLTLVLIWDLDNCSKMTTMFKIEAERCKLFEVDSRVGLNGSNTLWSFPCLQDDVREHLIVWLGDINIEKFTKTTFMNLVNFGEKANCKKIVFVVDRDHNQKGT